MEILEEMEREDEDKKAHLKMLQNRIGGNNSSLLKSSQKLEPLIGSYVSISSMSRFKSSGASPSKPKIGSSAYQPPTTATDENLKIQLTNGQELEEIDIFNLNNNINKFSYQNVRDEKELRELKLQSQNQPKFKAIEKVQKKLQLKQNIELFKDQKVLKEQALKEIREGVKQPRNQSEIKLPKLPRPLNVRNHQKHQFSTMQQKKMID